jgi:uncharacterized protein
MDMLRLFDCPADNAAVCGHSATIGTAISPDGTPVLGKRYTVAARAFSARNRAEYLSWPHARASLGRIAPRVGDALATNRRRPILTLTEDTSPGVHDTLIAACDVFRYMTLGADGYHDNCSDNLRMAMMAIGQPVTHVPQPFNVWMNIPVNPDWSVEWKPPVSKAGDAIVLRAEMDCIVAMSACPQDMIPINGENMTPVEVEFVVEA